MFEDPKRITVTTKSNGKTDVMIKFFGTKFFVLIEGKDGKEGFYAPYHWAKDQVTDNPLLAANYDSFEEAKDVKNTILLTSNKKVRVVSGNVEIKLETEIKNG
jgi:hypothetical protein